MKNEVCELGLALIEKSVLLKGGHGNTPPPVIEEPCKVCIMELRWQVGVVCGWEDYNPLIKTDRPNGDSDVLSAFLRTVNDRCTDKQREELKQFVVCDLSDKGIEIETKRGFRCADWCVREITLKRYQDLNLSTEWITGLNPIVDNQSAVDAAGYAYAAAYAAAANAAYAAYAAAAAADYAGYWDLIIKFIYELIEMGNDQ